MKYLTVFLLGLLLAITTTYTMAKNTERSENKVPTPDVAGSGGNTQVPGGGGGSGNTFIQELKQVKTIDGEVIWVPSYPIQ
jgi:hypothetical protein